MANKLVEVYCDGACSGNPGRGGWGAVLLYPYKRMWRKLEISCGYRHTTNNRMELTAAIEALKRLKSANCNIKLYSDSQYMISPFKNLWICNWVRNDWKNVKGENIVNIDLWKELLYLHERNNIEWIKVKGHSGNKYNEKCDFLAASAKNHFYYKSNYSWISEK